MFHSYSQVACALLMKGENLDNFIDVKNILIEMGSYFQIQVVANFICWSMNTGDHMRYNDIAPNSISNHYVFPFNFPYLIGN